MGVFDEAGRTDSFDPRLREGGDLEQELSQPTYTQFRSTPPRGRRQAFLVRIRIYHRFRSTPPRGRRLFSIDRASSTLSFRSTPPRGRRLIPLLSTRPLARFRSTPPRGRRPSRTIPACHTAGGFDPRLREGGDAVRSVHQRRVWFRSTPPRGRRHRACGLDVETGGFDPRLREGGDFGTSASRRRRKVSIHASAREATLGVPVNIQLIDVSIHASAREAT